MFEIHLSFDTLVTMFIRIKQGESDKERSIQLVALFEVLEFLVIPDECYHSYLEHYFEVVKDNNKEPCEHFCTYCKKDHLQFTGLFYSAKLLKILTAAILNKGGNLHWREFIKVLKVNKTDYFHEDDVPVKLMGPIHALAMQLLAKGIVQLKVSDRTKVGTKSLNDKDIIVALSPEFYDMDKWDGLTTL